IELDTFEGMLVRKPDIVCVPVFCQKGTEGGMEWDENLKLLDERSAGELRSICAEQNFKGAFGKSLYIPRSGVGDARRLLLYGCGHRETIRPYRVYRALSSALKAGIKSKTIRTLAVQSPTGMPGCSDFSAVLNATAAVYDFTYRSLEARESGPRIESTLIATGQPEAFSIEDIRRINSMAGAPGLARDLVNTPANIKRTDHLVAAARRIAQEQIGVQLSVVEDTGWIEKNMPCFFLVARGSLQSDPPKWIHLKYTPSGEVRRRIILVGKSVIFDTGGYQVKPDQFMNTMKADMTGGATVLAVMQSLAELRIPHLEVHAMLAATPNMIDSNAMTPDAIVNTTCGKKVEIRHTDAEGRLTLIDAVAMAMKENPDLTFTVATLTGAATRAVGDRIALMSPPGFESLRNEFGAAAEEAGDPVQTLDVLEDDYEAIKSKLDAADICNSTRGRSRGAQSAAAFVFNGAQDGNPILHLDIAGGDMSDDEKATGIAVRAILLYLLNIAAKHDAPV
ncbi:MAG: leucyl aminopeptidase family protein, partial [Leptospiraceae bacterium]|nr:leucyl aminopeptidase family protein [Leptospiraceae bacterium]